METKQEEQDNALEIVPPGAADMIPTREFQVGAISVATPLDVIDMATKVAKKLDDIIKQGKLYKNIQGRKYVFVEGWTTCAAMLGIVPREVSVEKTPEGDYIAIVELVRTNDGMVIGRGSAVLGIDEETWSARPEYAKRSMAVTRATGKACRLAFSWIISLAGYAGTPYEEMKDLNGNVGNAPVSRKTPPRTDTRPGPNDEQSPFAGAEAEGDERKRLVKKMHALGVERHGSEGWDQERPLAVAAASDGRAGSSNDLTDKEVQWIIDRLEEGPAEKKAHGPDGQDAAWDVEVHFGKNKGVTLRNLGDRSLVWYQDMWRPEPYKGKCSDADLDLRRALNKTMGKDEDYGMPGTMGDGVGPEGADEVPTNIPS